MVSKNDDQEQSLMDGFFQLSLVFDVTSDRRRDCRAAITIVTRTSSYIAMVTNTTMTSTIPSLTPKDLKNEWIDHMRDLPDIQYGDIYNYLVSNTHWGRRGFKSRIRPPYPQRAVKGD